MLMSLVLCDDSLILQALLWSGLHITAPKRVCMGEKSHERVEIYDIVLETMHFTQLYTVTSLLPSQMCIRRC